MRLSEVDWLSKNCVKNSIVFWFSSQKSREGSNNTNRPLSLWKQKILLFLLSSSSTFLPFVSASNGTHNLRHIRLWPTSLMVAIGVVSRNQSALEKINNIIINGLEKKQIEKKRGLPHKHTHKKKREKIDKVFFPFFFFLSNWLSWRKMDL